MRSSRKGTIPGVTGLVEDEDDKWIHSNLELTNWEEKLVVASVVQVAIIVMMNTHLYSFNGKIFQQTSGGPIGLRATCACARVVMNSWDIACMRKIEMNNVVVNLGMRYMDDTRLLLGSMEA